MFYELMQAKSYRLESQISILKQKLNSYPSGKLIFVNNGGYTKWFISDNHTNTYLPKKQKALARQFAEKGYIDAYIKDLEVEKEAIHQYLTYCDNNADHVTKLTANSNYLKLTSGASQADCSHAKTLNTNLFNHNESVIAKLLLEYDISFEFKAPLFFDDITYYPSFTIKHPQTDELVYIEIFDCMENSIYRANTYYKLDLYALHGILPGKNLIALYGTENTPVNVAYVRAEIEYFFS